VLCLGFKKFSDVSPANTEDPKSLFKKISCKDTGKVYWEAMVELNIYLRMGQSIEGECKIFKKGLFSHY